MQEIYLDQGKLIPEEAMLQRIKKLQSTDLIEDIEKGIETTVGEYIIIEDRTEEIRYALNNASKDDIIVLAGKGHETYQMFKDKTIHYDEREIVAKILNE